MTKTTARHRPRTVQQWNSHLEAFDGMTLRDYIATAMLPACFNHLHALLLRENVQSETSTFIVAAKAAVEAADALIAELRK